VDGTARPQSVAPADNELYWRLINEFHEITGIPILVNTSLNLKGQPMACTARDTLLMLDNSDIDFAAIGCALLSGDDR